MLYFVSAYFVSRPTGKIQGRKMKKTYTYIALFSLYNFAFMAANHAYIALSLCLLIVASYVSAHAYKHFKGSPLVLEAERLPILRFLSFVIRDSKVKTEQSDKSLFVVMTTNAMSLSCAVCILFARTELSLWTIGLACAAFSVLFAALMTRHFTFKVSQKDSQGC
jgi:cobalamin synthase